MSIIVVGSVFVDIKGYPSRTYIPGGRNAGKVRYVHGGVSRNIAEDLGNLGLQPVFLSLVDPNGAGRMSFSASGSTVWIPASSGRCRKAWGPGSPSSTTITTFALPSPTGRT